MQPLDLGALKLHHLAAIQVDKVIMVLLRRFLVTGSAVAERVPLQNAGKLQPLHRSIDGGQRDTAVVL